MTKTCNFCKEENTTDEEFCRKCGAKLPFYQELCEECVPVKAPRRRLKISIAGIAAFVFSVFCAIVLLLAIFPYYPEDALPDFNTNINNAKAISNSLKTIQNEDEFDLTVHTNPRALSLYLTSLDNPEVLQSAKFKKNALPRIIFNAPADEKDEISLIHRQKKYGIETRFEMVFEYDSDTEKWEIEKYRLGNLPFMEFRKDKIFNSILQKYSLRADFSKAAKAKFNLQRSKSYIYIDLKYGESKKFGIKR